MIFLSYSSSFLQWSWKFVDNNSCEFCFFFFFNLLSTNQLEMKTFNFLKFSCCISRYTYKSQKRGKGFFPFTFSFSCNIEKKKHCKTLKTFLAKIVGYWFSTSIEIFGKINAFHMCVCVCVCIYIYIYIYTHTHTHIKFVCVFIYIYIYI